jgi:addiction module HigA family antidote
MMKKGRIGPSLDEFLKEEGIYEEVTARAIKRATALTPKAPVGRRRPSKNSAMRSMKPPNPHPGEILRHEFLDEIGMSQNQLAHAIGVPGNRIHAIVNATRDITGDTDLRLCKFFGLTEGYFLRLQNAYDMMAARRRIAAQLAKIKPYKSGKAA